MNRKLGFCRALVIVMAVVLANMPLSAEAAGTCERPRYDDRCEKRVVAVRTNFGEMSAFVASRRLLVVAGTIKTNRERRDDYKVQAFDARTHDRRWTVVYDAPSSEGDDVMDLAIAAGGRVAVVTGRSYRYDHAKDWLTIGISTSTGKILWIRREDPSRRIDGAEAVVASPDGKIVYVTGAFTTAHGNADGIVAYDAVSGRRLWRVIHDSDGYDYSSLDMEFGGDSLYFLESRDCYYAPHCTPNRFVLTGARPSASGLHVRWKRELPEPTRAAGPAATSLDAGRGAVYFAQELSKTKSKPAEMSLTALSARSGKRKWRKSLGESGFPYLELDSANGVLYLGIEHWEREDYIHALRARSGHRMWRIPYTKGAGDRGEINDLLATARGLYVTGTVEDTDYRNPSLATVAFRTSDGRQRWFARYEGLGADGYPVLRFRSGLLRVLVDNYHASAMLTYEP